MLDDVADAPVDRELVAAVRGDIDAEADPGAALDGVAGGLALQAEVAQPDVAGAGGVFDLLGVLDIRTSVDGL
ncbi:hypothetical protein [Streptomyces solaniscabiei]|uniref:hypothetical protein n=1 Tax=Streptomyces solaniscabiei TaxID=2683255 RepID=UPI001CE330EB|nr:hypothetical protein [Streptomyces solaniscabiei]